MLFRSASYAGAAAGGPPTSLCPAIRVPDRSVLVTALPSHVPTAANIRHYANIVRERSILRQLASTATEIAESAFIPLGRNAQMVLDEAEAKILHSAEPGSRGAGEPASFHWRDGSERIVHEAARLHLDERDRVATRDDEIDLGRSATSSPKSCTWRRASITTSVSPESLATRSAGSSGARA